MLDIALDGNGDLLWKSTPVSGSDIDYVESSFNHIVDLLDARPGEIRQFPTLGANMNQFKLGRYDQQSIDKIIKTTLNADGWKTDSAKVKSIGDGVLEVFIDPKRND